MNVALALAQILIPMIPSIVGDVESLVNWITSIRSAALQTGEWSAKMDGEFRAAVLAAGLQDPAFRPDPAPDHLPQPAAAVPPASPETEIPSMITAQGESNAPINEPGASAAPENTVSDQKAADQPATAVTAASEPYLPDGTKNPAFNHLA